MNAKKTKNADTETMGNKTQRSVLNSNELAQGQANTTSGNNRSRAKDLLADTGESKAAKAKTRRAKKAKLVGHKETLDYYAVIIQRKDGSQFYSLGQGDGKAMFYKHKDAVEHKKALKRYKMNAFVVKVTVAIEGKK